MSSEVAALDNHTNSDRWDGDEDKINSFYYRGQVSFSGHTFK